MAFLCTCCSVIGRLVSLIYQRAHLEAEVTAIKRQAEQASRELQRRLQEDADKEVDIVIYMYASTANVYTVFALIMRRLIFFCHATQN